MDDLGDTFDVIIIGTGMPECILAAAAARIGKSVLHLDRNGHYGGNWASFNFDQLLAYLEEQSTLPQSPSERMIEAVWLEQLNDNERLVLCPKNVSVLSDIVQKSFIKDKKVVQKIIETEPSIPEAVASSNSHSSEIYTNEIQHSSPEEILHPGISSSETSVQAEPSVETPSETGSLNEAPVQTESVSQTHTEAEPLGDAPIRTEASNETTDQVELTSETPIPTEPCDNNSQLASGDSASTSNQRVPTTEENSPQNSRQEWTLDDFKENRRKFNLDLTPKLLFARGSLVELLITSNIARYAEFQCVSRVLTFIEGRLEQVPCSRADVFSTKNVNVVEKRMLMKLLTFCMEFQKHPEEYRGFEGKPYLEFLRSRKVTPNIEHYVLHAIAMVDESCPTLQGLTATQKFMESLGRYGNSPFLWSCFGSAELPQCFCRLCAVFGGIYHLKRDADAVILNQEEKCIGIISAGKKISCQSLIMEFSYAPLQYVPEPRNLISQAIYVTDSTILPAERQQNTLLRLPPISGVRNVITVLEFGSLSFICPDNLYVAHMTCRSLHESVEEDFKSAEADLFDTGKSGSEEEHRDLITKPKILWCTYFRQKDTTSIDINSSVPGNLFLTSSPDSELDYEAAVAQARDIFEKLYPGEEFLPRAPDPEDIIMDEYSNPGEKDEFHEDNPEYKNIENDAKNGEKSSTDAKSEVESSTDVKDAKELSNISDKGEEMNQLNKDNDCQNTEIKN